MNEIKKYSYQPNPKEKEVLDKYYSLFRITREARNKNLQFFDGLNLVEYINDSVLQFTTNEFLRDDIKDWQSRVHDPFIRNKVLSILGKVVSALPVAQIVGRGDEDARRAFILDALYQYSEDVDGYEELIVFAVLEALVKGTCVGFEGYEEKKRKIRDIKGFGDETKATEKTIREHRLFGEIVPLENFYPASIGIRKMKDMSFCFVEEILSEERFKAKYKGFKLSKNVLPRPVESETERVYFIDYLTEDVRINYVQVLKYFDQEEDEYVILANGVWLNPLKGEVAPLPFNHKRLPFWVIRYDIFGADFFYGKSMPDKLKALSNILDVFHNMLIDQSLLTVHLPVLFAGIDAITEDFLLPGGKFTIDTGGLPINQVVQTLDLKTPGAWHQFILDYTKRILEESSLDSVQQGVVGTGERTTATEIRQAASGVVTLLGIFAQFINFGLKDKTELRSKNILQFWSDKNSPMIEGVLGQGGSADFNKAFNVFVINDAVLTSGKRGALILEFYQKENMPLSSTLESRQNIAEAMSNRNIEIMAINPDYLRSMEFDIKIVPNTKSEFNRDMERIMEGNFQTLMNQLYPDLIYREELCATLIEKYGKNPAKIMRKDVISPPPQQIPGTPMQGAMNAMPQNLMRGQTGQAEQGVQMRDLQG